MTQTTVRSKTLNPAAIETLELAEFHRNGNYNWQHLLDFVGLVRLDNAVHSTMWAAQIDRLTETNLAAFGSCKSFGDNVEHLNKVLVYLEHVKARVFHTDQTLFVNFALLRFYVVAKFVEILTRLETNLNQVNSQVANWKLETKKQMMLVQKIEEQKVRTMKDVRNGSRRLT